MGYAEPPGAEGEEQRLGVVGLRYRAPGLGRAPSAVEEYTSSLEWDDRIAAYAAKVMLAHLVALVEAGVLGCRAASRAARVLARLARSSGWLPREGYEDVFEALEAIVAGEAGLEATNAWVGRSRNDHVAAALRLYTRDKLVSILDRLLGVRATLLSKARAYQGVAAPTFSHGQVAQATTVGHVLSAYEEALADAWTLVHSSLGLADSSPLGASAGAGTIVPLDRWRLAGLLGFQRLVGNTYRAVADRLFLLQAVSAAMLLYAEVSRIAEDLVALAEAGVAVLPDEHLATSSIMPHKRNPVTLEVLRARAGDLLGALVSAASIYKRLRYGYNLDMQEMNKHLFYTLEEAERGLGVLADLLERLEFDRETAARLLGDKVYWGAEAAEALALRGTVFREAHRALAEALRRDGWSPGPETRRLLEEAGLWPPSPEKVLEMYKVYGAPSRLRELLDEAAERLERDRESLAAYKARLAKAEEELWEAAERVASCA